MNDKKELITANSHSIDLNNPDSIKKLLEKPSKFLTGILASRSYECRRSAGNLIQGAVQWNLYSQIEKEINHYIKKGKIKKDYLETDLNKQSIIELLKFIDEESPDEKRFEAVKTLFFKSIFIESDEEEKTLAYQLIKICKQLNSEQLLIIKAAYDIIHGRFSRKMDEKVDFNNASAIYWLTAISKQVGHCIPSLIEVDEDHLINIKLIQPRVHTDRSGIKSNANFRLTVFGMKLCSFIYDQKNDQSE